MEKGFEKIILQFTTDFENTLLFKGVGGIKHFHNDLSPAQREIRAIAFYNFSQDKQL